MPKVVCVSPVKATVSMNSFFSTPKNTYGNLRDTHGYTNSSLDSGPIFGIRENISEFTKKSYPILHRPQS